MDSNLSIVVYSQSSQSHGFYMLWSKLPKELQDIIHTYNADHRNQMNEIIREIRLAYRHHLLHFTLPVLYCDGYDCDRETNDPANTFRVFVSHGSLHTFCSEYCQSEVMYEIRKTRRMAGLHDPYTLTYKGRARQLIKCQQQKKIICSEPMCENKHTFMEYCTCGFCDDESDESDDE